MIDKRPIVSVELSDSLSKIDFSSGVEDALKYLPESSLNGLGAIVLRDAESLTRRERRQKFKVDATRTTRKMARGLYYAQSRASPAFIELYVDNILNEYPTYVKVVPPFRDFVIAGVLFHEIRHHIHYTKKQQNFSTEQDARDWSKRMLQRYVNIKYSRWLWLIRLVVRPLMKLKR